MIIAHSLQPPHGNPDILDDLIKEVVFEPTTHPIPCIHFSFGVDEILDLEKDIELEDFNKIPVPFRILPTSESVDKKSGGKQTYFGYLIAFNEPLLPQSTSSSPYKAPFKMRYRTKLKDAFNPLRIGKELSTHPDEFAHDVSTEGNHEVVELIMFYPENFFIKSNPRYRSTPTSEWQSCSSIDLTALDRISYLAPKGYQKIGWISKNLQMGGEVQVDLWR
jgi:hypothetical protein